MKLAEHSPRGHNRNVRLAYTDLAGAMARADARALEAGRCPACGERLAIEELTEDETPYPGTWAVCRWGDHPVGWQLDVIPEREGSGFIIFRIDL